MNALRSARGTAAAPPRDQNCSCDGGGWIVTLDRDRYKAPGTAEMVRCTRCICLDVALGPARPGGAKCRMAKLSTSGAERTVVSGQYLTRRFGEKVALDDVQFAV